MMQFRFLSLAVVTLLGGCDACKDSPTGPSPQEPNLSIHLNTDTVHVEVGDNVTVTATTEGADQVNWSSPNPAIVSLAPLDKTATITAVSVGVGRVFAALQADMTKRDTVIVIVSAAPVEETPRVHGISMTGNIHGKPGQIFYRDVVVTADADSLKEFTCNSSNPGIVGGLALLAEMKCKFTIFGIGTAQAWAETINVAPIPGGGCDRLRAGINVFSTPTGAGLMDDSAAVLPQLVLLCS
jgi:hypothetical protein